MPYDPDFLSGAVIAPPTAPDQDPAMVLDYMHFTVAMNPARRLAWWSAWNIDGRRLFTDIPRHRSFFTDERIPSEAQSGEAVYADNRLDRGHLARRADLLWGNLDDARTANRDSFCFTNITPQMDDFNQSGRGGVWGELENAVLDLEDLTDRRLSVIAGPVLADDDPPYRDLVQVPVRHWKVVVYRLGEELRWRAFVLEQDLALGFLEGFDTYQVDFDELESVTGLSFASLAAITPQEPLIRSAGPRPPIETLADIHW